MDEGWPEEAFTEVGRPSRRAALVELVPLTGTKWDALLAAMVEHVAWLHGHERPAWVDEPERFLDATWVVADTPWTRLYSVIFARAAFLRHGAVPDPRDLDARGGEPVCVDPLAVRELVELFEELSSELRKRGARAHVYVVGGRRDERSVRPGRNHGGYRCAGRWPSRWSRSSIDLPVTGSQAAGAAGRRNR